MIDLPPANDTAIDDNFFLALAGCLDEPEASDDELADIDWEAIRDRYGADFYDPGYDRALYVQAEARRRRGRLAVIDTGARP